LLPIGSPVLVINPGTNCQADGKGDQKPKQKIFHLLPPQLTRNAREKNFADLPFHMELGLTPLWQTEFFGEVQNFGIMQFTTCKGRDRELRFPVAERASGDGNKVFVSICWFASSQCHHTHSKTDPHSLPKAHPELRIKYCDFDCN